MSNCPHCGNECKNVAGKRPKIFCTPKCRTLYWLQQRRDQVKATKELEGFSAKNSTKSKVRSFEESAALTNKFFENLPHIDKKGSLSGYELMIDMIKMETIPPERDTIMGRKVWKMEQEKRIKELELLLGYPV